MLYKDEAAVVLAISPKTIKLSVIKSPNEYEVKRARIAQGEVTTLDGGTVVIGDAAGGDKLPPVNDDLAQAYAELCQIDFSMLSIHQKTGIFGKTGILRNMESRGITGADLRDYGQWYAEWRGWAQSPPTDNVIRKTWKQFLDWRDNGRPKPKTGGNSNGKPKWKSASAFEQNTEVYSESDWQ